MLRRPLEIYCALHYNNLCKKERAHTAGAKSPEVNMGLVSAKEMLEKAREGKYAVGQFNINNLEWTKSILATAQELNAPLF